ncbi:MAG: hypothetical protein DWQ19_09125 [Crenarchaeota archaeon]|nr:MAG: hypothetical protein DWQ19_09125 [Thermoproteota archaeon]
MKSIDIDNKEIEQFVKSRGWQYDYDIGKWVNGELICLNREQVVFYEFCCFFEDSNKRIKKIIDTLDKTDKFVSTAESLLDLTKTR